MSYDLNKHLAKILGRSSVAHADSTCGHDLEDLRGDNKPEFKAMPFGAYLLDRRLNSSMAAARERNRPWPIKQILWWFEYRIQRDLWPRFNRWWKSL